ncbi:SDR family oxidoreductase [Streptomyces sp. Ac-502]|uniref:SDR family oxidoreductase n=1 Tax=Streptomyces sp. Ac-502 TaxID=3342801 RepID=UPI0038623634
MIRASEVVRSSNVSAGSLSFSSGHTGRSSTAPGWNITVNPVVVGFTRTDMTACVRNDPATLPRHFSRTALGRIGQAPDTVDAVAFLTSGDARWITGAEIDVTGGVNLERPSKGPSTHLSDMCDPLNTPRSSSKPKAVAIRHAQSGIPMLRKARTVTGSLSGTDRRTPGDFCRRNIRPPAGHQRPRTPVAGAVRT